MKLHKLSAVLLALLAACAGDEAAQTGPVVLDPGSYVAVVTTDYSVSAISVLDRSSGELVNENVFDSSSTDPGVSLALSGDVVLPNEKPGDGVLLVVDRGVGNNTVTILETTNMTVQAQISVGTSNEGPWAANPHDALIYDSSRLYVTRYEANPAPTPSGSDFDDGDDVIIIDLGTQEVAERFELGTFADPGSRAAPDRLAVADGLVAVTLQHYEGEDFSDADEGLIAFIDPETEMMIDTDSGTPEAVDVLHLDGVKNCSSMEYLESTNALYAVCSGLFADGRAGQITASAIVAVDMDNVDGDADFEIALQGGHGDIEQPLSALEIVSDSVGFVLTYGSFDPYESDQLFMFDPSVAGGDPELVFTASGPFQLTAINYDEASGTLFVADAPFGGPYQIRRFAVGATVEEIEGTDASPEGGLGPTSFGQFEVPPLSTAGAQ